MKKKLNNQLKNSCFQNKKLNLSKILKNTDIFKDASLIQQLLVKGTISTKNYDLKRLSKKIRFRNNEPKSFDLKREGRDIPFELANILEKSVKKFDEINNTYKSLKKENDTFISYFNYTKKIKEKLEKLNNSDNDLLKNNKNSEFKKVYKMFNFSNRDKIEFDLQKNLSKKIFNQNPLLINNDAEMYFYFSNKMNESKNKAIIFNEQNSFRYLNKVKDFMEYYNILSDKEIDDFNRQIKLSTFNFTENQRRKTEEENIKLLTEQEKIRKKEIAKSKKMIKYTKRLLYKLAKNKNYLDDPNYFTFHKKINLKALTPNRMNYHQLMNKSSKSDFFVLDKSNLSSNNKYDTERILKLKKDYISKKIDSFLNESSNKKIKKIHNFGLNDININPLLDKNNNESYIKENNTSYFKKKFYSSQMSNEHNNCTSTNSMLIKKNNNIKKFHSVINYFPRNSFIKSSKDIIQQKLNKKNYSKNQIQDSINMDSTSKEINSISNNETDYNIANINNLNKNAIMITNNQEKFGKNNKDDKNKIKEENNKNILILSNLYEEVKDGKILDKERIEDINYYIKLKGIEYKKKKNTIKNLKDVKILLDKLDINKIAKDFRIIKNKENTQIIKFMKIDNKLRKLDKKYIKDIIEFKANTNIKNK